MFLDNIYGLRLLLILLILCQLLTETVLIKEKQNNASKTYINFIHKFHKFMSFIYYLEKTFIQSWSFSQLIF